jgi:hypothetical protein
MGYGKRLGVMTLAIGAGATLATSAAAADTTEVTLAAGLGLTAASGKTTLGAGAGAIEAGVLGADAFQQAGAIIAALVNRSAAGKTVLVTARDEQANLALATIVKDRIDAVTRLLQRAGRSCPAPKAAKEKDDKENAVPFAAAAPKDKISPALSDVVAALATETAISGIELKAEDRLLINAVLSNRATLGSTPRAEWSSSIADTADDTKPEGTTIARFRVAGEATRAGIGGPVAIAYKALLDEADKLRTGCTSAAANAAFTTADALVNSLNTPAEKTGMTPLAGAMQAESFSTPDTRILRLAIEQTGGTAITRAGIAYTLGFPNAAMVSAGLVVSFRLVDPTTGAPTLAGIVRCAVPPQNFKAVAKTAGGTATTAICAYRAA